jgi:hypothetical protein
VRKFQRRKESHTYDDYILSGLCDSVLLLLAWGTPLFFAVRLDLLWVGALVSVGGYVRRAISFLEVKNA